jgi:hypothetical protein
MLHVGRFRARPYDAVAYVMSMEDGDELDESTPTVSLGDIVQAEIERTGLTRDEVLASGNWLSAEGAARAQAELMERLAESEGSD